MSPLRLNFDKLVLINSLKRSGFYIIAFLLIFSCKKEDPKCDPLFDPNCGSPADQSNPETSNLEADVDSSSVSISWESNEFALSFSYRLEPLSYTNPISVFLEWSEWFPDTSVTLEPLDEGEYSFYVKSRFNIETEEETPKEVYFTIDAIPVPALRIYPMDQEVDRDSSFQLYVYASNIQNILIGEIYIEFDNSIIEYNVSESSCGFNENYIPDYGTENVGNTGNSGYILYYCNFNGSDVELDHIVKIDFTRIGDGNTEVIILDNSIVRDSNGDDIEIEILQNGWVR